MITATMEKKTVSSAVKGSASVNAFANALIGNAGKGGGEDDHRQANQADLSQVKSRGHDQPNANERLAISRSRS